MLSAIRRWGSKKPLEDPHSFQALEHRIRTILPEEYQDSYQNVEPVSMGSAGLKYGEDGKVAWDDIWDTFCDLAMAGGPPHKGKLLEPGSREEVEADPGRYKAVVEELCRGIRMVADLAVMPSPVPGWVRVDCGDAGTAAWLVRAVVMENVSARCEGENLDLPAGPAYRVEKEIKNVITVVAKTCHYFLDHTSPAQQRTISNLFAAMGRESALIQPALAGDGFEAENHDALRRKVANEISRLTGLAPVLEPPSTGWLGFQCPHVKAAIWMMRGMVASNVLARREETTLFVPINAGSDPGGDTVAGAMSRIYGFALAQGIL